MEGDEVGAISLLKNCHMNESRGSRNNNIESRFWSEISIHYTYRPMIM